MSIFTFLISFFNSIFNATRNAWNHLPPAVQSGIKNGSGIISIISQYIGQAPGLTIATIQANYSVNLTDLYSGLSQVAKAWGLEVPATLEDLIIVIQTHLKGLQGSEWDRGLSFAAQILGDIFTGAATPFGVIVSIIEFVYQEFIKGATIANVPDTALNAATASTETKVSPSSN